MSKYKATVIKTGNSYALRVPKAYIENARLRLGQKVQVEPPVPDPKKNEPEAIKQAIKKLRQTNAYKEVPDPVAWQRKIRQDRPLPGRHH